MSYILKGKEIIRKILIGKYQYPESFIKTRISQERDLLLLNTKDNIPFLAILIVNKITHSNEARLKDIIESYKYLSTGILVDSVSDDFKVIRYKHNNNTFEYLNNIETYKHNNSQNYIINERNNQFILDEKIENIFYECHSIIRDFDGMHPDEALDELCKLLYLKINDEENTKNGKPLLMQKSLYCSNDELSTTIRSFYDKSIESDKILYSLKIPNYERSRGVFNKPIKLSNGALSKIIAVLENYNISSSNDDIKGRAFQNVLDSAMRYGMGQYFTPSTVVEFMVEICDPDINDLIMDPFCGSGHFLSKTLDRISSRSTNKDKKYHDFAFNHLHGIEKSERMVRIAMTDMRLHGDGHSNIRCIDALLDFSNYSDVREASFDIIMTNPPFGSILDVSEIKNIGHFELRKNKNIAPLEILGLERCYQLLKAKGKLAIIVPDGLLSSSKNKHVLKWVLNNFIIKSVISLPIETFHPFGASIKTSILFMRKKAIGEKDTNYKIFMGIVDNIGYDNAGRNTNNSDLPQLKKSLINFLKEEGW